jgi:putative membrane protein
MIRLRWTGLALLLALTATGTVQAHGDQAAGLSPQNWWHAWNWDIPLLALLAVVGWRYTHGVLSLWRRAGVGRGVQRWQLVTFWIGLELLFIALVSPLDPLGETLLSAHMVQHMVLMLGAAPLLVLGATPAALAWAVPRAWRRGIGRWWHRQAGLRGLWSLANRPLVAWSVFAVVLWGWHAPALYEASLRSETAHILMHASFLAASFLFWWVALQPGARKPRWRGGAVLFIFTTSVQSGLLGALMTFSSTIWYSEYVPLIAPWGLTPLEDQQLAGLIMWVLGGMLFTIPALAVLGQWLNAVEQDDRLGEPAWRAESSIRPSSDHALGR